MVQLLEPYYGKGGFTLEPAVNPCSLRDSVNRYFTGGITIIDNMAVETAGTLLQQAV
jgi:hypothetical protein